MNEKCKNCKYCYYYEQHGYACSNSDSEYVGEFIGTEDWCDKFTEKESC